MGLATCLAYDSQLPWWAYFVSIILALVFVIPTSSVLAISNIALALNVLSPFLAGFMIPGRPIGVMMFKGKLWCLSTYKMYGFANDDNA